MENSKIRTLSISTDIGVYPQLFTFVSLPYRAKCKGLNETGNRYVIHTEAIKLELVSSEASIAIPTGRVGRLVFAYLSSKIVKKQFGVFFNEYMDQQRRKGEVITKQEAEEIVIKNISDYTFSLPNITFISKELFGYKAGKYTKETLNAIIGILRMVISATSSKPIKNLYIPNHQFTIATESYISSQTNTNETDVSRNTFRLTSDGLKLLLQNAVPICFEEYKEFNPIEQDLLVIFLRKTHNPQLIEKRKLALWNMSSLKNDNNFATNGENLLKQARQTINYSWLVKQIFNVDTSDTHYSRYKESLLNAWETLTKKYSDTDFSFCVSPNDEGFDILGSDDLIGLNAHFNYLMDDKK